MKIKFLQSTEIGLLAHILLLLVLTIKTTFSTGLEVLFVKLWLKTRMT